MDFNRFQWLSYSLDVCPYFWAARIESIRRDKADLEGTRLRKGKTIVKETRPKKGEKHMRNRDRLAAAAQETLQEKGYSRTSLRDIAARAGVPLGTLHYYFSDKADLLVYSFQISQNDLLARIRETAAGPGTRNDIITRMSDIWTDMLINDSKSFLLWYDLRNQALFEPKLRPVVTEMESRLIDALEALFHTLCTDAPSTEAIRTLHHPLLSGMFFHLLQEVAFDRTLPAAQIAESFQRTLEFLVNR